MWLSLSLGLTIIVQYIIVIYYRENLSYLLIHLFYLDLDISIIAVFTLFKIRNKKFTNNNLKNGLIVISIIGCLIIPLIGSSASLVYKTDGIFRSQAEIDNYVNDKGQKIQPKAKVGDLKFVDVNNNGKIDSNDRTEIGSGFPDFTYGLGLDLAYKGFDFSMFWQGVAGYDIFNALKYEGMFVSGGYNNFAGIMDRYHPENNPNGSSPRVTVKDVNGNRQMSDYYVDKGDYLRLKNLTFGYTFDRKLTSKFNIQKLRLYITAQNLITFTKYKGFDPELGETYLGDKGYQTLEMGVDRGQFPQAKTFIMGLNINF